MIPKCHMYNFATGSSLLCFWEYQPSVVRIKDGILLARRIDVRLVPLNLGRIMIDLIMYLCQKRRRCRRKPSPATKLK
jgi:hypothetical protein